MGAMLFVGGQGLVYQCRNGILGSCAVCAEIDTSEWLFCIDDDRQASLPSKAKGGRRRRTKGANAEPGREVSAQHLEELTRQLFQLHDLNGDGLLQESELITLNEKIAILHHGKDTDTAEVRAKYSQLFREKLHPEGQPVAYEIFRQYAAAVLDGLDNDPEAQEMILEQFVAEARSGRQAFDLGLAELLCRGNAEEGEPEVQDNALGPVAAEPAGPKPPRAAATYAGVYPPPPSPSHEGDHFLSVLPEREDSQDPQDHEEEEVTTQNGGPNAGCTDEAVEGPPPENSTSAEDGGAGGASTEDGGIAAKGCSGGGSAPKKAADGTPGGAGSSSEDTAPGEPPPVMHCATESSLDDDMPMENGVHLSTLQVKQRNVRRTDSFDAQLEAGCFAHGEKSTRREEPLPTAFRELEATTAHFRGPL